jgi:hypothetical protein
LLNEVGYTALLLTSPFTDKEKKLKQIKLVGLAAILLAAILLIGFQNTAVARGGWSVHHDDDTIALAPLATYATGVFDEGASEIVAYDKGSERLFIINADAVRVDVLDISDPANPVELAPIDASPHGGSANSVAAYKGIVAVAIENEVKTDPGSVVFFDADGNFLNQLEVGALPDMVTFTPNGRYLLVANEGEPNDDYTVDPEGTVSIIKMRLNKPQKMTQANVQTVSFAGFNNQTLDPSIRIFGPNATVAQDLEPEYITVSDNSRTAWVVLQENNAMARINIRNGRILNLYGLGFKDHSQPGNGLDASNRDGGIHISNWPVLGMFQPDGIAAYAYRGRTFVVSANEGDARDYDGYSEEERIGDLTLDPVAFPNAADLQDDANLGRLNSTTAIGDTDGDGDFDQLYAYGARSFSIWTGNGRLVYDSGEDFEQITAAQLPAEFNSNNDENGSFDARSDDKGPEPEGVAIGKVGKRTYAFIGLERIGGIMVYDITNPYAPTFVQYVNNRDFSGDAEAGTAGDLGPEGITFISQKDSPTHTALLVVGNEVSGSTTIYAINEVDDHHHDN